MPITASITSRAITRVRFDRYGGRRGRPREPTRTPEHRVAKDVRWPTGAHPTRGCSGERERLPFLRGARPERRGEVAAQDRGARKWAQPDRAEGVA